MGYPEQLVQQTFASETELITRGAVAWQDPPEIRLERVQADGFLIVRQRPVLDKLPAPWSEASPHQEVMVELKMPGNHLDRPTIERALLRRQARQLQRLEDDDAYWLGDEPLWVVAPHVPDWLRQKHQPQSFAEGCYWVESRWRSFLWIAANELPLVDELIPFLMARSGAAQAEFLAWVMTRRPNPWVMNMVSIAPMSPQSREELLRGLGKTGDPVVDERQDQFIKLLLEARPDAKRELIDKGRTEGRLEGQLIHARASLRRLLARRRLAVGKDEDARITACADLATLERWLDQADTAASAGEALE